MNIATQLRNMDRERSLAPYIFWIVAILTAMSFAIVSATKDGGFHFGKSSSKDDLIKINFSDDTSSKSVKSKIYQQAIAKGPIITMEGIKPALPPKCFWASRSIAFGDIYILYRVAKCHGKTSSVSLKNNDSGSVSLVIKDSVISSDNEGETFTEIFDIQRKYPYTSILKQTVDTSSLKNCEVKPNTSQKNYKKTLIISPKSDVAEKMSWAEKKEACGKYSSLNSGSNFWHVSQGYAWYFNLGSSKYMDIDPRSLTLATKAGNGKWKVLR